MIESVDQLGNSLVLKDFPRRIISLVPSQTELLYHLELDAETVGITKFCIHPDSWFKSKQRIGGTKNVNLDLIRELQPDLVIGNKEENTKEDIVAIQEIASVWMSDIYTLDDSLEMILEVGRITNRTHLAQKLVDDIKLKFSKLRVFESRPSCLYFMWYNPHLTAGTSTFIHEMIECAGFRNMQNIARYPIYVENSLNPDFVFLSSEPFPFSETHLIEFQEKFPNSKIVLVDGEMFSWYGSRLFEAADYLFNLRQTCMD